MKKFLLSFSVIGAFALYVASLGNTGPVVNPNSGEQSLGAGSANSSTNGNQSASAAGPNPSSSGSTKSGVKTAGAYKDGTYTGSVADAFYGNVQVQVTVKNGKIADVSFLNYPNDRGHSIFINTMAMPMLKSEAMRTQSANVDGVSGATLTSQAFSESLSAALASAKS